MENQLNNLYQQEKNILLQSFIDRYYKNAKSVEFIISTECNQACEYCYLHRHGDKMYPPESNDKNNILRNFKLLLDYLHKNDFQFTVYDLFSGEFFQLSFWENIFEILYEHPILEAKKDSNNIISIPTNFSFLLDESTTKLIENWIYKFRENKGIQLYLSCSVDGPEDLEELERPIKGYPNIKQEDFYDKLFNFLNKHNYVTHPMITKNFVLNYKENYDFWIDNIIKYNYKIPKKGYDIYAIPMMLEVRDPDQWDSPEVLQKYREFLFYMAEKDLNTYHEGNLKDFAFHVADDFSEGLSLLGTYNHVQPYTIGLPNYRSTLPCSIQGGMVCRVGDLKIVPCHRTCYPHMIFGEFIVDENKNEIIGVQGDKISLAHKIQNCNPNRSFLRCSDCEIKTFCLKGCIGSQYENTNELFGCQDNVCNLFKMKYKTINDICEKYGLYDIIFNEVSLPEERKEFIKYVRQQISRI